MKHIDEVHHIVNYEHTHYNKLVAAFRGMHVSLGNISMRDYQLSVTTDRQTDAGQNNPYVPLYLAGNTKIIKTQNYVYI